jgi:hypothetical protein
MEGRPACDRAAAAAVAIAACALLYSAYLVVTPGLGMPVSWQQTLQVPVLLFPAAAGGFLLRAWWFGPVTGLALAMGLVVTGAAADRLGGVEVLWSGYLQYAASVANLAFLGGLLGWGARLADDDMRQTMR